MSPYSNIPTPLPIGNSFFDSVIENGYYYVDKTLLIKDLLDQKAAVTLFTRPRRFGKTLNQTMLKCFFEDMTEVRGWGAKYGRSLFKGLKIELADGGRYMEEQGQYPVVYLSLKGAKQGSWELSYSMLKTSIMDEFRRHNYLLDDEQLAEKEHYRRIMQDKGSDKDYAQSLRFLTECLEKHHGKRAVILIDEYDVPLENAWFEGFYDKMIKFIRSLFESALKDNPFLKFAVLTGCLRVSRESIFTGLNNLDIISILTKDYSEYFGFTQVEVEAMLRYYKLEFKTAEAKDWYNGYLFGDTQVYNPWSTIKVVRDWLSGETYPRPYWSNTSSNDIVRKLVDKADDESKEDLAVLIAGGSISKTIHEDVTYDEVDKDLGNLWNFLFFTGYLTKKNERIDEEDKLILELSIPNRELRYIFNTKIDDWFREKIRQKDYSKLYTAILAGDTDSFEKELSDVLFQSISYLDNSESFYHGLLIGILAKLQDWSLKSNREAGWGRSDIYLKYKNFRGKAIIFELKYAKKVAELDAKCDEALAQIEKNKYIADLEDDGYKPENIIKYGIAFNGKNCMVKIQDISK